MLQLILGRSGAGKTFTIYQQLSALTEKLAEDIYQGDKPALMKPSVLLLVPEQFSFESERALLKLLGPSKANIVQVLSFTRLAETVFRELGGLAGRRLDDSTRVLLMSHVLDQLQEQLTLYGRHTYDADYIQSLLSLVTEWKQGAVTAKALEEAAEKLEDGTLRQKTAELSQIFAAYEAVVAQSYIDPLDDLSKLVSVIPQCRFVRDSYVFVDAFKGFTEQEMRILDVMMGKVKEMTVALCTDTIDEHSHGYGRFSSVVSTASRLRDNARKNHIAIAPIQYLNANHRTASPALRLLEKGCFTPTPDSYGEETADVTLVPCSDIYGECAYTARHIRSLLRRGERCRDIAVVMRNLTDYQGILDVAMEQEQIPFYMDARQDILTDPLITLVLSALRITTERWHTEDVFRLLKTGLLPFSAHSISTMENYVYQWRINAGSWKQPWKWNPDGFAAITEEKTLQQLEAYNRSRLRLVQPLQGLEGSFEAHKICGNTFAKAIYDYLQDAKVIDMFRYRVHKLVEDGEEQLASSMMRVWDALMEILDKFAVALQDTALPAQRFTELFQLAVSVTDIGVIPQMLDAVQIGSADRIRFSNPKIVFILGANEGVFPAYPLQSGLLSEKERKQLIAQGLTMTDTGDYKVAEERFFAYMALSAPSSHLFISYIKGNAAGESLLPSSLVETVRRILPHCCEEAEIDLDGWDIESPADAFIRLSACWNTPKPLFSTLYAFFSEHEAYRSRMVAMQQAAAHEPAAFLHNQSAIDFWGKEMRLSPSRVEKYHLCRFAYFCQYGMNARTLRPADLDAAEFGTFIHYIMERLLPVYQREGFENIDRNRVWKDTDETVAHYVEAYMNGVENQNSRFLYLLTKLTATCRSLLWHVVQELRQSRFVPTDYELEIGRLDKEQTDYIEPVRLTTPEGIRIWVQGKVDRVDTYKKGDTTYVRVVDYKTGQKEFRLSDVVEGINLQMLIYLISIWLNGSTRYGQVEPAGMLYLPAKLPVIKVDRHTDDSQVEKAKIRVMRMNGLLLDNPEIIKAMENDAAGLFIPARLQTVTNENGEKEEGLAASSSVASLKQFGQLKKRAEKLLTDMAATLAAGDIAAIPAVSQQLNACQYCDYKAVCGHEQDDPVRRMLNLDTVAVLKDLQANDDKDGKETG